MGLWALKDGVWYRVDEYYYDSRTEGRQKTDEEYVDALEELTRGRRIERVIVDPSAASFIETLRRRGFRVMRANNAVAEFRRSNLGSVEIRFIDRVKALQALAGMLEGEGCEAEEFFRAMVQAEEET